MPWAGVAGSETFSRTDGVYSGTTVHQQAEAAAVGIRADRLDTHNQDIATGLNVALKKDGGNTATGNIPMGGFKHTGLGAGSAAGHSMRFEQIGMHLLASGTVAAAATLDFVLTSYTGYRGLIFHLSGFKPATDNQDLYMLLSTDAGANYLTAGYNYMCHAIDDTGTAVITASGSAARLQVTTSSGGAAGIGSAATEGFNGEIKLFNQASAAFWTRATWNGYFISADATPRGVYVTGGGAQETAQDTDAVRFLFSSGNITAGNYAVYGLI
jgi:hypothetical protein